MTPKQTVRHRPTLTRQNLYAAFISLIYSVVVITKYSLVFSLLSNRIMFEKCQRETERQRDRETERQRNRETKKQRDRQTAKKAK